jgi:lipase ATG15
MHIPLITTLTAQLLPFFSTQPTTPPAAPHSVTLRPIHAHGHRFHGNDTRPQLLFQDATHPSSFISLPPASLDGEEIYLDRPKPDIASESLTIRTKVIKIRRPLIKPPSMTSWGISAQYRRRRKDTSEGRLPPLPIGTRGDNASEVWRAPNYEDEAENGVYDGWEDVDVVAPDVHDRQTLITLAKMTSDAYTTPDQADWYPLGKHWNATTPFGWEPDSDGLRGHIVSWRDSAVR